jgi:hypothetical protein
MIRLTPMTDTEYNTFYDYVILDYAEGLMRAGNASPGLAVQVSQQQCAPVLSDEVRSPNQFFYLIRDDALDAHVRYLWWRIREQYGTRVAMLYFVGILEPY